MTSFEAFYSQFRNANRRGTFTGGRGNNMYSQGQNAY